MTPAERLNEVLRITRTNVKSLSERLGYARPQGLYDVAAGRTKSLSNDLCRKIVTAFPDFSYSWLLTGEGEMLTTSTPTPKQEPIIFSDETMRLHLNMSETIHSQQETIQQLTDMLKQALGMHQAAAPKKDIAG